MVASYIRHCIILLYYCNHFRLMAKLSIEAKRITFNTAVFLYLVMVDRLAP